MQFRHILGLFGLLLLLRLHCRLAQSQQRIQIVQGGIAQRLARRSEQAGQNQKQNQSQYRDDGDSLAFAEGKPLAQGIHIVYFGPFDKLRDPLARKGR